MNHIKILAAGSLRKPFTLWAKEMAPRYLLDLQFAPAGLIKDRISAGEQVDLFASANEQHPQSLQHLYPKIQIVPFASNRLCLIAKKGVASINENWLNLLMSPNLRLGISTPKDDPCGDYALSLFENIDKQHPGYGIYLKQKAQPLVGGKYSEPIPATENTADWLFKQNKADLFIGYASNHQHNPNLTLFEIPAPYNIQARYTLAVFNPAITPIVESICSGIGQDYLQRCGFLPAI